MTWIQQNHERLLRFKLYLFAFLIGLSVLFASKSSVNDALDNKEVALVTHNWQNRPISWFSLNNIMGGMHPLINTIPMPMVQVQ